MSFPRGVNDTLQLDALARILYDRPAGRNIIGHAIDTLNRLRREREALAEFHRGMTDLFHRIRPGSEVPPWVYHEIERRLRDVPQENP